MERDTTNLPESKYNIGDVKTIKLSADAINIEVVILFNKVTLHNDTYTFYDSPSNPHTRCVYVLEHDWALANIEGNKVKLIRIPIKTIK